MNVEELQKRIKQGMVGKYDMRLMRYNAVSRDSLWRTRNKRYVDEYMELRNSNPELPSIEDLRPE